MQLDAQTRAEEMRSVFATPFPLVASLLNGGLCIVVLWRELPPALLLGWAMAMAACLGARFLLRQCYHRRQPRPTDLGPWLVWFTMGAASAGALWGALAIIVLFGGGGPLDHAFVVMVVSGMGAGAIAALAPCLPALYAFLVSVCLPLSAALALHGGAVYLATAAMVAIFLVANIEAGRALNRSFVRRTHAEMAARRSERHYRLLADHSTDMIAVLRLDGHRVYVSPGCRVVYGYEPAEMLGRDVFDILHPSDAPHMREALARCGRGQGPEFVTYRGRRKTGEYAWIEAGLSLAADPETREPEIICIVRDVTERVQAEAALRQAKEQAEAANRAKGQFLAAMSHELRTPLNAILGFSEIISDAHMGPVDQQYRSYGGDIHASGQHLLALINDVLDLSKVEVDRLELHEEPVDVREIVNACRRLVAERAHTAGVILDAQIGADMPPVFADKLRLKQILLNLLSNAVKFTPAGGRVSVRAALPAAGGIDIIVADTGIGMRPEEIPLALEPFRQIDSALNRRYEGTGLGLPLAKRLVELHGGALEIESERGCGTTVRVRLPENRILPDAGRSSPATGAAG